jgi:YfiH family protein
VRENLLVSDWLIPDWPAPASVLALSTTRIGGASSGPYASMNLGAHVGDDERAVQANRRELRKALGLTTEPCWLRQVHGTDVVAADSVVSETPMADAAVSRTSGRACAVLTADCLPVLFAARNGSAVGAAHAGWRGLAAGVLENTIAALAMPPDQLLAWLGPAISQTAFEVGPEVRDAFAIKDPRADEHFRANANGRLQADLYGLARQRLRAAGLTAVFGGGWCTFREEERFFSYRRDQACGRMATIIALEASAGP